MAIKSDNQELIGRHDFEVRGLGLAPYTLVGFENFLTGCDRCGKGIRQVFICQSFDGKRFNVGCDCINKAGDAGLIKAYKSHPDYREMQRQKANAKDERVKAEWAQLMGVPANLEKLNQTIREGYHGPEGWASFALRAWGYCGASGRAGYLSQAKKLLAT